MGLEPKAGIIIKSNTQETLSKERNQVKDDLNLMVVSMKVISSTASSMEWASITLQIQGNFTKENSKTTTWKAKV